MALGLPSFVDLVFVNRRRLPAVPAANGLLVPSSPAATWRGSKTGGSGDRRRATAAAAGGAAGRRRGRAGQRDGRGRGRIVARQAERRGLRARAGRDEPDRDRALAVGGEHRALHPSDTTLTAPASAPPSVSAPVVAAAGPSLVNVIVVTAPAPPTVAAPRSADGGPLTSTGRAGVDRQRAARGVVEDVADGLDLDAAVGRAHARDRDDLGAVVGRGGGEHLRERPAAVERQADLDLGRR